MWRSRCGRTLVPPDRSRCVRNTLRRPASVSGRPRVGPWRTTKHSGLRHPGGRSERTYASALGEENAVDGHNALLAALADDTDSPQAHVHIGRPQTTDLSGSETTQDHRQHHRPVAVGVEVGEEGGDIFCGQAPGEPLRLAHHSSAWP